MRSSLKALLRKIMKNSKDKLYIGLGVIMLVVAVIVLIVAFIPSVGQLRSSEGEAYGSSAKVDKSFEDVSAYTNESPEDIYQDYHERAIKLEAYNHGAMLGTESDVLYYGKEACDVLSGSDIDISGIVYNQDDVTRYSQYMSDAPLNFLSEYKAFQYEVDPLTMYYIYMPSAGAVCPDLYSNYMNDPTVQMYFGSDMIGKIYDNISYHDSLGM